MSRLTRDGTAEPVSRVQILRHARGREYFFPVQLTTSRIGNLTRLIHTLLYVMTIHSYIPASVISSLMADDMLCTAAELTSRSKRPHKAQGWCAGPGVEAEMNAAWRQRGGEEAPTRRNSQQ